jgi:hypothetical protein
MMERREVVGGGIFGLTALLGTASAEGAQRNYVGFAYAARA